MTTRTRTNKKMNLRLENLESREAPTVGLAGAWQAAMAQAMSHSLRGSGFQGGQQALQLARPGSTFQSSSGHMGVSVNASGGASRAPMNPTLALGQSRQATPVFRTGTVNRVQSQPAFAGRSFMRAPATNSPPSAPSTPMTPPNSPNNNTTNTTSDAGTPAQSLPANISGALKTIYQQFQGSSTVPVTDGPGTVVTDGTNVGVSVHGNGQGSFSNYVSTLRNLGMQISATNDVTWTIAGMLPIKELPTAAQAPQTLSITPMYRPVTFR